VSRGNKRKSTATPDIAPAYDAQLDRLEGLTTRALCDEGDPLACGWPGSDIKARMKSVQEEAFG
jgi:hypothetical protein